MADVMAQATAAGESPRYTLRRARPSDADAFVRMMAEPEVYGGLMQLPYPDAETWRQRLADGNAPGKADVYLVAEAHGEVVGSAGLHPTGPALRRRHVMMMGISVDKDWQGKGVGTALMQGVCDYADHWLAVWRIELTVFADNARAIALYKKFGFEVEGTHRGYALRDGQYADVLSMARIHPNPPTIARP